MTSTAAALDPEAQLRLRDRLLVQAQVIMKLVLGDLRVNDCHVCLFEVSDFFFLEALHCECVFIFAV